MPSPPLRIGIVGCGDNTRRRHIPGLRACPEVEIVAVCNRTPESTARVAARFGIPRTFADWKPLVASRDIDAVVIGTWPCLHCDITLAALDAGKHVLCEARMARDLAEARRMVAAAAAHPHLVTQIVPSPFGLACGTVVRNFLQDGMIGDLREVVVISADDSMWDYSQPLHWRQRRDLSGNNVLALGIMHETVLRWVPEPTHVFAQSQTFEASRPVPDESRVAKVDIPDSLQVLTQLAGGARGVYHISGVTLFGPGKQVHLYGSRGTIKLEFLPSGEEKLSLGRAGDTALATFDVPESERGRWRVEEEFLAAIRGEEPVRLNDFPTALRSMEFTEAVTLSYQQNQSIALPLK